MKNLTQFTATIPKRKHTALNLLPFSCFRVQWAGFSVFIMQHGLANLQVSVQVERVKIHFEDSRSEQHFFILIH